jgi:hypothetical protein
MMGPLQIPPACVHAGRGALKRLRGLPAYGRKPPAHHRLKRQVDRWGLEALRVRERRRPGQMATKLQTSSPSARGSHVSVAAQEGPSGRNRSTRNDRSNHHVTDHQVADPDKPGHPRNAPRPHQTQPLTLRLRHLTGGHGSDKRARALAGALLRARSGAGAGLPPARVQLTWQRESRRGRGGAGSGHGLHAPPCQVLFISSPRASEPGSCWHRN